MEKIVGGGKYFFSFYYQQILLTRLFLLVQLLWSFIWENQRNFKTYSVTR